MKNRTNTMPDTEGPATLDSAECPAPRERKVSTMDPTLRAAAKLDRLLAPMTPWMRSWAIQWLTAKYLSAAEPVAGTDPRD